METPAVSSRSTLSRALAIFLVAITALLGVLLPAPRALAQEDMERMIVIFNPMTRRSLDVARTTLSLDADQSQVAKELFAGYRAAVKNAVKDAEAKGREAMEKASASGDYKDMQKLQGEIMSKTMAEMERLEKSFNEDLKAVLTAEQAERFSSFERARRREHLRLFQLMAGEGADVIDILDTLKIDRRKNAELAEIVKQYETTVDRSVSDRLSTLREFLTAMMKDEERMDLVKQYLPRIYEKAKATRDLNRQTARRIAEMLPPEDRTKFEAMVQSRSFPSVYKTSRTAKALEAARKFDDLSESQKSEIESIATLYTREVDAANKAWAQSIESAQDRYNGDIDKMRDDDEAQDATDKARQARLDVEKKHADRLEALLKKEQVERLPVARPDDDIPRVRVSEPDVDHDIVKDWKGEDE